MVSTFTTNKSIEEPASGDYINTWATPVNADWSAIDNAFGGVATINIVGLSGSHTFALNQYQPPNIIFSGTITANLNYQLPSGVGGLWTVYNNTTGAFTLTMSSLGAGTSVVLAQGFRTLIVADGTNVSVAYTFANGVAGSNSQIQYNNSGSLGASASFTFDGTNLRVPALRLFGASSGSVTFQAASIAGSTTYTLPSADGTAGQILTTNGSATLSWASAATASGVSSWSAGTTGFTPNTATTGAVTLGGVLNQVNGGTGSSTGSPQFTALGIGTPASGTTGEIRATNNVTSFYSSDRQFKENIQTIENALSKVCAIGGKTFDWTDEYLALHGGADGYFVRKSDFGCIAQDVLAAFPVAVREREDETLALDYEKLCALAFEAIIELRAEVRQLREAVGL